MTMAGMGLSGGSVIAARRVVCLRRQRIAGDGLTTAPFSQNRRIITIFARSRRRPHSALTPFDA